MEKDLKRKALRGDIVSYHGKHYFYQPLGQTAYLYLEKNDIGVSQKVVISTSPALVTLVKSSLFIDPRDEEHIKVGKLIPIRDGLYYEDENEHKQSEELIPMQDEFVTRKEMNTEIEFLKRLIFDLEDRVKLLENSVFDLKLKTH